jgi:tryptophan-rich sensory protein
MTATATATPAHESGFSTAHQTIGLIGWLALCFGTAFLAALASIEAQSFYAQLTQPSWAPPAWLFGPVWTALYLMMALAAWLVWRRGGWAVQRKPLALFLAQLAFNALWSWLFFAWHLGALGFADILVMWVLIAATIATFWRVSRPAALLLVPYIAWVSFAAVLNFSVWQLNPGLL